MYSISFRELREMTPEERDRILDELVRAAQQSPDGEELAMLEAQVQDFEQRFGLSSEELRRQVSEGTQRETDEVLAWLMLLNRRDRLASFAS